ncbi:flagellar motor protein MotB [uncultured Ferrimonas sp.]|uniref:flagellar motor protein MotB n=1 Tax=uncultured Ferrimonas sp. TaxID=432640 RepID=UPI002627D3C0|nr:flagellar motor protein MotB [uncultured Ferrimonas sp.]
MNNQSLIIINKKHGRHKPHGGGWKVAFADMMVALMAFFMLLWILEASSQEEREAVVFNIRSGIPMEDENMFTTPNSSIIDFGAIGGTKRDGEGISGGKGSTDTGALITGSTRGRPNSTPAQGIQDRQAQNDVESNLQQMQVIQQSLEQQFGEEQVAKHIRFEARPDGLRIVLSDNVEQLMFRLGSADMEPFFQDLLLSLATLLQPYRQRLLVSGHTDSAKFSNANGNWVLSSNRALEARRALELGGIPADRFLHVAGFADTIALDPNKPDTIANRRVELFMLNDKGSERVISSQRALGQLSNSAVQQAQQNRARQLYQ